jgi:hypothetical protein
VLTRQELDETREQFVKGQKVIERQIKSIKAQNLTSALQYEMNRENAQQAYGLNLVDKRFPI